MRGGVWECATRRYNNLRQNCLEYTIGEYVSYAILFAPQLHPDFYQQEIYCGVLCKDKRLVFIFSLIVLPFLVLVFFVLYKM